MMGTIIMVEHGLFEGLAPYITLKPEKYVISADYKAKFGEEPIQIPVEKTEMLTVHMMNFLDSVRSRKQPTLQRGDRRQTAGVDLDGGAVLP